MKKIKHITFIYSLLLLSVIIFTNTEVQAKKFELPKPLSQAERERLRNIGLQNFLKYGNGPSGAQGTAPTAIKFSDNFVFDGSETTDLTKVKDISKVENFTIDTKYGWKIAFKDPVDLTDTNKRKALQEMDKMLGMDNGSITIKDSLLDTFGKGTFDLFYTNKDLTKAPQEVHSYIPYNEAATNYHTEITDKSEETNNIVQTENNDIKITISKNISDGDIRYEIVPRVKFVQEDSSIFYEGKYTFTAQSSFNNLTYALEIDGKREKIEVLNVRPEAGVFTFNYNLKKGPTNIKLYFTQNTGEELPIEDSSWVLADEINVDTKSNWIKLFSEILERVGQNKALLSLFIAVLLAGMTWCIVRRHKRVKSSSDK